MRRLVALSFILLFADMLVGLPPAALAQAADDATDERQVWAFYLSFWAGESTWDWNAAALDDYPLLGRYNSKLPEVAAQHIQQAQSAGIDAFWVNWWGLDENVTTTPALVNLLDRAAEQDFKIAAVVDLFPADFNRDYDQLVDSMHWLIDEAAAHPAYLQVEGKPLIAFAFQYMADYTPEQWASLREAVDPDHETIWLAEGLSACCLYDGVMDGMYAFNMAWAEGEGDFFIAERNLIFERGGDFYVPTISPGWNEDVIAAETGRPNPTSRKDRAEGQFLTDGWNAALETDPDAVLIVSWNEFIENSHIEPSEQYGTQSLDTLTPLIEAWRDEPIRITPVDMPTAYGFRVDAAQDALATPSRDAAVVATLEPGTVYPIVDEDGGLYGVLLDEETVYIPWELGAIVPIE